MWAGCWILVAFALDLWLKREEQTGDCQAITDYQQGCRHKITDWQRFRKFVQQHGDKTQGQLAALWGDNRPPARIRKGVPVHNWAEPQWDLSASQIAFYGYGNVQRKGEKSSRYRITYSTRTRNDAKVRLCCFSCFDNNLLRGFLVEYKHLKKLY